MICSTHCFWSYPFRVLFCFSTMALFHRNHCWFLFFIILLVSSLPMSATTCSYRGFHWNYFDELSYYCHTSSLFFPQNNVVILPAPLLIVIFWNFLLFLLFDDCNDSFLWLITLGITFLSNHIIAVYHYCVSPSTMSLFHRNHYWLLNVEVYLSFFLTDEQEHLFGLLNTLEVLFWAIILSSYIIHFFPARWPCFTVTIVDCYVLKF